MPGGEPPGTGSGAELGNFQPALPGRIHPAATYRASFDDEDDDPVDETPIEAALAELCREVEERWGVSYL